MIDIYADKEARRTRCYRCGGEAWKTTRTVQGIDGPHTIVCHEVLCAACEEKANNPSEESFIREWMPRIEKHFHVDREIEGKHFSGKTLRIDAVIRPRDTTGWANPNAALGLEFKSSRIQSGASWGDTVKWLAQSVDYSNTKWDRYGYIYTLVAGGINPIQRRRGSDFRYLQMLAAHLGVGELQIDRNEGLSIVFSGEHLLWTEVRGPIFARKHKLERKWGAR
jgi:hypothetical protein